MNLDINISDNKINYLQLVNNLKNNKYNSRSAKDIYINEKNFSIYLACKRNEFENLLLKKGFVSKKIWLEYIRWEENLGNFENCRILFERFLKHYETDPIILLKYIGFELRNNFPFRTRKIFERSLFYRPDVDKIWLKYIEFERIYNNISKIRELFKRWILTNNNIHVWKRYINVNTVILFELNLGMRSYIIKIIHFVTKKFRSFPIFNLLVDYELDNGTMKSLRHIITVFYEIFQKEEIEKLIVLIRIANVEFFSRNYKRSYIIMKYINEYFSSFFKQKKNSLWYRKFDYLIIDNLKNFKIIRFRKNVVHLITARNSKENIIIRFMNFEIIFGSLVSTLKVSERGLLKVPVGKKLFYYRWYLCVWEKLISFFETINYTVLIINLHKTYLNFFIKIYPIIDYVNAFFSEYRIFINYENFALGLYEKNVEQKLKINALKYLFEILNLIYSVNSFEKFFYKNLTVNFLSTIMRFSFRYFLLVYKVLKSENFFFINNESYKSIMFIKCNSFIVMESLSKEELEYLAHLVNKQYRVFCNSSYEYLTSFINLIMKNMSRLFYFSFLHDFSRLKNILFLDIH